MDQTLARKEFVYFNPGKHEKSFKIKAWDLKKVCQPKMI
jgi:prolyl-tRNA editing enzyme YbaK/EbsC (Cys-tRNA(Pro) deacylase)